MYSIKICIVTDNLFFKLGVAKLINELPELSDVEASVVNDEVSADVIIRSNKYDNVLSLCQYFSHGKESHTRTTTQKHILVYSSTQQPVAVSGCCIDYAIPLASPLIEFRFAIADVIKQLQLKRCNRKRKCRVFNLTDREYKVMQRNGEGRTMTQIAQEMSCDPKTISYYKRMAMRKLGIENNSDFFSYSRFVADYEHKYPPEIAVSSL